MRARRKQRKAARHPRRLDSAIPQGAKDGTSRPGEGSDCSVTVACASMVPRASLPCAASSACFSRAASAGRARPRYWLLHAWISHMRPPSTVTGDSIDGPAANAAQAAFLLSPVPAEPGTPCVAPIRPQAQGAAVPPARAGAHGHRSKGGTMSMIATRHCTVQSDWPQTRLCLRRHTSPPLSPPSRRCSRRHCIANGCRAPQAEDEAGRCAAQRPAAAACRARPKGDDVNSKHHRSFFPSPLNVPVRLSPCGPAKGTRAHSRRCARPPPPVPPPAHRTAGGLLDIALGHGCGDSKRWRASDCARHRRSDTIIPRGPACPHALLPLRCSPRPSRAAARRCVCRPARFCEGAPPRPPRHDGMTATARHSRNVWPPHCPSFSNFGCALRAAPPAHAAYLCGGGGWAAAPCGRHCAPPAFAQTADTTARLTKGWEVGTAQPKLVTSAA